ncbi:BRCA2 and CDKN1A-interacting protein, partial [Lamellibrachia satsuma]
VQVEFEARNPEDHDFHGIRKLLQQLFLKAHVDLSELTDLIISQNYVGSVIKELMGDEEEEDDDDVAETFGIVTVVNITERKAVECVKQFKSFLLDRSAQCITAEQQSRLKTILDDNGHQVGLLLSERFVNIPPQIALPSYESLVKEMERAIKKGMKYKFAYYVMISKTYKMPQPAAPSGGRRKQNNQTEGRIFVNAEEEFFHEEATLTFDYSVKSERDTAIAGEWNGTADELEPLRTVCVIPGDRMQCIMGKLR